MPAAILARLSVTPGQSRARENCRSRPRSALKEVGRLSALWRAAIGPPAYRRPPSKPRGIGTVKPDCDAANHATEIRVAKPSNTTNLAKTLDILSLSCRRAAVQLAARLPGWLPARRLQAAPSLPPADDIVRLTANSSQRQCKARWTTASAIDTLVAWMCRSSQKGVL